MPASDATLRELKRLIVESLHLEGLQPDAIEDEAPLFGGGLGLDSVDALELVVAIEGKFGISLRSEEIDWQAFRSVRTLADYIEAHRTGDEKRSGDG